MSTVVGVIGDFSGIAYGARHVLLEGTMMVMTDEQIMSAAARLRAARRRPTAKTCDVRAKPFQGIASRRYCSDRCRVRASRERATTLS